MANEPKLIRRRRLLAGAAAASLVGNKEVSAQSYTLAQSDDSNEPHEVREARIQFDIARDEIRNQILAGKKLQDLAPEQLRFLRGDDDTLKAMFPKLYDADIEKLKPLILFDKKDDVISIDNTGGVLTAQRKKPGTEEWERAGFSLPKGVEMTEEEAFRAALRQKYRDDPDNSIAGLGI